MSVLASNPQILHREVCNRDQQSWVYGKNCFFSEKTSCFVRVESRNARNWKKVTRGDLIRVEAFWSDLSKPTTIEMEPIADYDQLDQALVRAQELSQPIVIDWMASWCRKCIYLKPKLEKLAADYDTKTRFYCVDVNKVPQTLVKRGNISKMPTIQLWKDGEMKEEVIGGHKGWLVMEEVKEMINKFV